MNISHSQIAKHFGISRQSVYAWFKCEVPATRVIELEKISGVPRYELRPDLYPPGDYKKAS